MLYFAYGSNLSFARFLRRIPSAQRIASGVLSRHRLCYHKVGLDGSGKCDALYTGEDGDHVLGVIYRLSTEDKKILDRAEGRGRGYETKIVSIVTSDKKNITAFTYYATQINPAIKPFHWYKNHVLRGAEENRFPSSYCERFLCVASVDDPDFLRTRQEEGIHRCR